jgi:hypothetical protein
MTAEPKLRWNQYTLGTLLVVLLSASVLGSSWALAQRRFGPEVSSIDDVTTVSVGRSLLVTGALPWLLQWAALATALFPFCRRFLGLRRQEAVAVTVVPLAVGIAWWTGLVVTFWSQDPLEALTHVTGYSLRWQLGGETLGEMMLYGVLGPLTCPFTPSGPCSLKGWNFLWTAASTAAIMLFLASATKTLAWLNQKPAPRRRKSVAVFVFALIYISPLLIRGIFASGR